MKTQPYAKPLKQLFEEVYVSYKDGDVFIYKPRQYQPDKLTRLCLPADYANNILLTWNQKWSKDTGNPWKYRGGIGEWAKIIGKVGMTLINSGESVVLHLGQSYPSISSQILPQESCNWSLDKINKKFSFELYLNNNLEETSPIVIADDGQSTLWTPYAFGAGTIGVPTLSDDTVEKVKGTDSLKMVVGAGSYSGFGIYQDLSPTQNWGDMDFICFYWYGQNTGKTLRCLIYAPLPDNAYYFDITENWIGWRRLVLPLRKFSVLQGTPSWSSVERVCLELIGHNTQATWWLDRIVVDVGQWVRCEVCIPDILGANYIVLSSWDGSTWQPVARRGKEAYTYGHLLYFLDGTTQEDITGRSYGTGCGIAFFQSGQRGETKGIIHGEDDPNAGNITYSSYSGCRQRLGFAIKMPPDDGQDSSTTGISQCRLKIEIRYDNDGKTTYEFEKSTNQYYGLDNINDSWLALFNPTANLLEYLILNRRPLGLEVIADHNEDIHEIKFKLKKGTRIWLGELTHGDHSRDTDGDGVPDIFEEDYDPNIVLDIDFNNEDETQNIAHDRSPNHNNGTIYGAKWADGKVGRALNFDGVDDYVDLGDILDFASGDEFTLEYWAKSSVNNRIVIDKGRHASPYTGWGSSWGGISANKVDFTVRDNVPNTVIATSTTTVTTGEWFHIVGVRGGGRVKLYVNGVEEADEPDITGDLSNVRNLIFGANSLLNVGTWFDGIIDEVRIYSRALSADEVKERYNLGKLRRVSIPRLVKKMGYAGW